MKTSSGEFAQSTAINFYIVSNLAGKNMI